MTGRTLRAATSVLLATLLCLGVAAQSRVSAATQTLVPAGSVWRYLDTGAAVPSSWKDPGFADSTWKSGRAQLGCCEGDEATVVNRLVPAHLDDYFRTTFTAPSGAAALTVRLLADDGALVYLNGALVVSDNIGAAGYPGYRGSSSGENSFRTFPVPAGALVAGTNTLAVDLRQNYARDTDSSFDLELLAEAGTTTTSTASTSTTGPTSSTTTSSTTEPSTTTTGTTTTSTTSTTTTVPPAPPAGLAGQPCTPGQPGDSLRFGGSASGGTVTATVSGGAVVATCTPEVAFLATGDAGTRDANQQRVADRMTAYAAGRTVDALVEAGDNVLPDGSPALFDAALAVPYASIRARAPQWVALGNHDVQAGHGDAQLAYLGLPGRYYEKVLSRGGVSVQLLFLDSNVVDATQTEWLDGRLRSGSPTYRVVVFHHTAFNCGTVHPADPDTYRSWRPVIEAAGADLVVSGHEHNYQRFSEAGTTFLVAGGGGQPVYPVGTGCSAPAVTTAAVRHFLYVRATGDALTVTAVDEDGNVIDQFAA